VYNVLQNSSVPINDFDNIISDIKGGITIQDKIDFDMCNLNANKIQNTVSIMKLLKKYSSKVSCLGDINNVLAKNLMNYISEAFVICDKPKEGSREFLQDAFTKCLANMHWENIDVDICFLFKTCNLVTDAPRSYQTKSNIKNNISLGEYNKDKKQVFATTVTMFMNLIHNINNIRTNLYIIYELYKYLNYLVISNPGEDSPLNLHALLHNTIRLKAQQFLYEIRDDYRTALPKHIFDLLVSELEQYISIA
jgi:hypothetical protein